MSWPKLSLLKVRNDKFGRWGETRPSHQDHLRSQAARARFAAPWIERSNKGCFPIQISECNPHKLKNPTHRKESVAWNRILALDPTYIVFTIKPFHSRDMQISKLLNGNYTAAQKIFEAFM